MKNIFIGQTIVRLQEYDYDFTGEMMNGIPTGRGSAFNKQFNVEYSGSWSEGNFEGFCIWTSRNSRFEGECK